MVSEDRLKYIWLETQVKNEKIFARLTKSMNIFCFFMDKRKNQTCICFSYICYAIDVKCLLDTLLVLRFSSLVYWIILLYILNLKRKFRGSFGFSFH